MVDIFIEHKYWVNENIESLDYEILTS